MSRVLSSRVRQSQIEQARLERSRFHSRGPLCRKPQPIAALPTWWFWNDPAVLRLAMPWLVATAAGVSIVAGLAAALISSFSAALIFSVVVSLLTPVVCLGQLERHVRREAMLRPGLPPSSTTRELQPRS